MDHTGGEFDQVVQTGETSVEPVMYALVALTTDPAMAAGTRRSGNARPRSLAEVAVSANLAAPAPAAAVRPQGRLDAMSDMIVAIAERGDREAFTLLFNHFAPRVKSYLLRLGTVPEAAEELAQETLLTVWRRAGAFDPNRAAASTWIFTIARNLRIDLARRERRPLPGEDQAPALPQPDAEPVTAPGRRPDRRRHRRPAG